MRRAQRRGQSVDGVLCGGGCKPRGQRALETRSGSLEEMLRASCRDLSDEQMIRQKVQQSEEKKRKERRQGDPTTRRKEDAGRPATASYGAGIVAGARKGGVQLPAKPRRDDSESGSDVGESFGDAGEDDELMLKRLEMAKKMAPQLFS